MLRYLWEIYGGYIWTDRHFEVLMRHLFESNWTDGIKIILRSSITHSMIKSLTPNERTYFIDNILGDIFNIHNSDTRECIMEELVLSPYAGSFIIHLIDKF